jgi:hypothetical protein
MTYTKAILKLLRDGVPRTTAQMAEVVGITLEQAKHVVDYLRDTRRIDPDPHTYTITVRGIKSADRKPFKQPSRSKKPDERILRAGERKQIAADVVQRAVTSRHALDSAWGGR